MMKAARSRCLYAIALLVVLAAAVVWSRPALAAEAGLAAGAAPPAGTTRVLPSALLSAPGDHDGQSVSFTAEVLDPMLARGDHAWLNAVDENGTAIGLWVPSDLARQVTMTGRFGRVGDLVAINGTFQAACPEHGGEADVHVGKLEVVARGHAAAQTGPTIQGSVTHGQAAVIALPISHRWLIAVGLLGLGLLLTALARGAGGRLRPRAAPKPPGR